MPKPPMIPQAAWDTLETKEMETLVRMYGKIYQFWDVDKGHKVPLGPPSLLSSFTKDGQFDFEKEVGKRDKELGTDYVRQKELRKHIKEMDIHPCEFFHQCSIIVDYVEQYANHASFDVDADQCWDKK